MQPIHAREARWFWQWDRLELARGIGLSFFVCGIFLLFAGLFTGFFPYGPGVQLAIFGLLLFFLAYCLDSYGHPHHARKLSCRGCRAVSTMESAIKNGWRCKKCGLIGRFDNKE